MNFDQKDIEALKADLAREGQIEVRLDPDEVEYLEELGFRVSVNYEDPIDEGGRKACIVGLLLT